MSGQVQDSRDLRTGFEPVGSLFTGRNRWILLGVFFAALFVYSLTCARHITGEDAGELVAAADCMGVAHPPGYPLWCFLAKGATLLPVGEVAFRVAFLSAILGALAVTLVAALCRLLSGSWILAVGVGLGFGLLRDQWFHAVTVEVYALNSVFLASSILLLIHWAETRSFKRLNAFALVYGLSLTNHHMMLGLAPVFLAFLLWHGWELLPQWKPLLLASGFFILGLLPYAYLPIAASADPPVNWGDPSTPAAFLEHVTRAQYSASSSTVSEETGRVAPYFTQLGVFAEHAWNQGSWFFVLLGLVGVILFTMRSSVGWLLGFSFVISSFGAAWALDFKTDFENAYASRIMLLPGYLLMAPALAWLLGRAATRLATWHSSAGQLARPLMAGALVLIPLLTNWETCDYSDYRIVDTHARRMLASVEQDAIVFPSSDHATFPILYLSVVEGVRPDVTIGDKYGYPDPPLVESTPYADYIKEHGRHGSVRRRQVEDWIIRNSGRPVYFSKKRGIAGEPELQMFGEGLWFRVRAADDPVESIKDADERAWKRLDKFPFAESQPSPLDYTACAITADEDFSSARFLLQTGKPTEAVARAENASAHMPDSKEIHNNLGSLLAENRQFQPAIKMFEIAVKEDPDYALAYRNLGIALRAEGDEEKAIACFERALKLRPADALSLRSLANVHRNAKNWAPCAVWLEELGKVTGDPEAFRDAGLICLFELEELGRAKDLLQESLSINPNQPEIRDVESRIRPVGENERQKEEDKERERFAKQQSERSKPEAPQPQPHQGSARRGFSEPGVTLPDPTKGVIPTPARPEMPGRTPVGSPSPALPSPSIPSGGNGDGQ